MAIGALQGGARAAAAASASGPVPLSAPSAEDAVRAEAGLRRRQSLALTLVVVGELLRIFRRPVYALALRR